MNAKRVARFVLPALAIVSLLSPVTVEPALALGTPQIVSVNPSSGAQVGVTVNIRARVDGSSDFRAMRICFRDKNWCQESGELEFERSFPTGELSPGWYTIRVEVAAQGDNSWSSPTSTEQQYQLTGAAQPTSPPTPPKGPSISEVSFNPSGGVQVGENVTIHIRVDSSNPGAIRVTPPCGGVSHVETTVPEFDDIWYTSGCGAGSQSVRVCARDVNDPNWANATCVDRTYSLSNPPPDAPTAKFWADHGSIQVGQCTTLHWSTGNASSVDIDGSGVDTSGSMKVCPTITKHYSLKAVGAGGTATRSLTVEVYAGSVPTSVADPTSSFQTGDIIKIGLDVYVIVNGARRHVPNPETLDALGISQNEVNNKGFSDSQLSMISKGSDIPDVNKDPSGFAAFKSAYFANRTPITPGGQTGQGPTGTTGDCPNAPALLKPGDIGVVTDYEPSSLRIRTQPGLNNPVIGSMPVYAYASIISGPRCADGYRWWEVGYEGLDGWSAEVGPDGLYNLLPNTMPMHGEVNPTPLPSAIPPSATQPGEPDSGQVTSQESGLPGATSCEQEDTRTLLDKLLGITIYGACTDYVNKTSQSLRDCWGGSYPDAGYWDDWARDSNRSGSCGWSVEPANANGLNNAKPGDIVVWNGHVQNSGQSCAGAQSPGHVAIFQYKNGDGTISVNGSNWSGDQNHTRVDSGCMSIIHIDSQPSQPNKPADRCAQYTWLRWVWCKITGR